MLGLTLYVSWVYDKLPAGDPVLYHAYAVAFWDVPPFFHAFPKEYPPLSLIPFSFTLWPASSVHFYWVFALWMGLIVCLSYVWFARYLSRSKAIAYACYLLVGATGTLLMRFDLLPALTTLGALILAERKHYRWAYALLAIGVLLKLYPAFLVPVLMAYQWRASAPAYIARLGRGKQDWPQRLKTLWRMGRDDIANYRLAARAFWQQGKEMMTGLGVFLGVTLLGFAVPALLNFYGTVSEFKYALSRPIQIESAPASLLWLGSFLGFPVQPNQSFASLNLVGPLDGVIKPISLLALVGGTLLVCWRVFNGKLALGQAFVALVAVVLVSNKLLSPQYIMWVLPLVAYVEGFDLLWLTVCALTTLIFPFTYQTRHPILMVPTNPAFLPMIALRNAFLVAAAVLAVRGRQQRHAAPALNVAEEVEIGLAGLARPELLAGRAPVTLEDQGGPEEGRKPLVKTTQ
ncbi:MAG TPA: glycosyltransferase family 87 protein [Ktedonobacterales bacterium]|nr:glycosyltransferase family 87 protein [Ktedonobacterales bacterium]